ncbi:PepSY domain-containing protein [Methylobacterium sp. J-070]|uniref:PepSY domain-containing protein n=1 Tax=Methylobacterium sp. J-070 TaxID=2836650 RepID=UPI001FB9ADF0|nr:PepSY domain-containing protein [Methylobacterium sp. J-070]MCJ2049297.1 PepSY domain-containing protein [Methylobacterium sp. J-070]
MKRTALIPYALVATLGLVGPSLAKEDKPGPDWMTAEQVNQRLMDAGYSSITELEADDGHWEGEGVKNGVKMEFHVDPKTGAITKEKPDKD